MGGLSKKKKTFEEQRLLLKTSDVVVRWTSLSSWRWRVDFCLWRALWRIRPLWPPSWLLLYLLYSSLIRLFNFLECASHIYIQLYLYIMCVCVLLVSVCINGETGTKGAQPIFRLSSGILYIYIYFKVVEL